MSTNNTSHTSKDWTWVGWWILAMAAVFAVLSPPRTPLMFVVYAVAIACGIYTCIHDDRKR